MNLNKWIDHVAAIHLEDYCPKLATWLIHDLCQVVQDYCLDEMEFERHLIMYPRANHIQVSLDVDFELQIRNQAARRWARDTLRMVEMRLDWFFQGNTTLYVNAYFCWMRIISPWIHELSFVCYRPCCFWRIESECICNDPMKLNI